ncbi:MAG: VWA domain-containing protein [Frankia sp.]
MTTSLGKGANAPLPSAVSTVRIVFDSSAGPEIDASALLLTESGKVRSDADFVFYNQPASADGAARHLGKTGRADALEVDVSRLPTEITTVALAASTDGAPFGRITGLALRVLEAGGGELFRFDIGDATDETAFVFGELYRRAGAWKFRAVGQGWASGLAGLATAYGISVDDAPPPPAPARTPAPAARTLAPAAPAPAQSAPAPAPAASTAARPAPRPAPAPAGHQKISMAKSVRLEKQLAGQPASMVNLVKRAGISLEKQGLGDHKARVALCLDISASMTRLYRSGKVQALCERVLGLAVQLDDDGMCDVFTFGTGGYVEGPIDLRNYQGWVDNLVSRRRLEGGTNYNKAMRAVREHYFPDSHGKKRTSPRPDRRPVYVMFVTDGHTTDQNGTRDQVTWSSYEPLFWQFMAIGASSRQVKAGGPPPPPRKKSLFGGGGGGGGGGFMARLAAAMSMDFSFLEELDDMGGRYLDNANFFSVADPGELSDDQLYDLMMEEYPSWLKQAQANGLVTG